MKYKRTPEEIAQAKKTAKIFFKWYKLAEDEQMHGYVNPYLGFQFTGDGRKLARYTRLAELAKIKLDKMGYELDTFGQGFIYVGKKTS
jgi:hypothetical protein